MSKVYVGQSSFQLKLTTGVDITGAKTVQIKYRKPDGSTTGAWTAVVESAATGVIYYDFAEGDLDQQGTWTVWAYIVFSDDRDADGEAQKFRVYNPGS